MKTIKIGNITLELTDDQINDLRKEIDSLIEVEKEVQETEKKWDRFEEIALLEETSVYDIDRGSFQKHKPPFCVSIINGHSFQSSKQFLSLELAENECHIHNTMMLMRSFARYYNKIDGFTPDWDDIHSKKYGVIYDEESGYASGLASTRVDIMFFAAVSSSERASQMLEEFKEDLERCKF
jgi:hypothetical protein